MLSKAPKRVFTDVPFANVPVPIDARVEWRFRIVEMNRADVSQPDCPANYFDRRFESAWFANVITSGERMRRVYAHTERQLRTRLHDRAQMFEAMADAFALAGRIFEENAQ